MSLYAYCISDDVSSAMLQGVSGIYGAELEVLSYGGLFVVVSMAAGSIDVTRDNVLTHSGVVSHVLTTSTPLPFRFGAVISQEQLDEYISANRTSIETALDRVRGAVEMSIRVIHPRDSKKREGTEPPIGEGPGKGASFLARKRLELTESEGNTGEAGEIGRWLAGQVRGLVRESATRIHRDGVVALTLANLVDRAGLAGYEERIAGIIAERSDLRFLTSGPWPPYSFCATSLELPRFALS